MVKKSGSEKSQPAGDDHKPASSAPVVVVGKAAGSRNPLRLSRRTGLITLLVVIVVGGGLFWYHQEQSNKNSGTIVLQSEQQVLQQELKDTLANPPSKHASTSEKTTYYDKLMKIQEALHDYKGAAQSFETRQQISTAGLDYTNYFYAASDACKASDKTTAKTALDQARKLLPAEDDLANGYSRANSEAQFDNLAQECGI